MKPVVTLTLTLAASAAGVVIWLAASTASAEPAPDEARLTPIADPLSGDNPACPPGDPAVPGPGQAVHDARFGTRLTRATRQLGLRHEYARFDPFNADRSMIILLLPSAGEFRVYRAAAMPYDEPQKLVCTLDFEEPRWDRHDPNLVWGLRDFSILTRNVATGETTTIKDFSRDPAVAPLVRGEPDLYRVTTKGEGEASLDNRYWALAIQGSRDDYRLRYLLCWDRRDDRLLGLCRVQPLERHIDWIGMSPLGSRVIVAADPHNGGRLSGVQLADRGLGRFHRIDYAAAHADVGLDVDGREVLVMQNCRTDYVDLIPLDESTRPILEAGGSYESTGRTPLVRLHYASDSPTGFQSGVHVSCNAPGWCLISTYTEPGVEAKNWLDRALVLVRLDPKRPRAFHLAALRNTTGAYWEETQAAITRDGTRIVWASNWGRNVGREQVFLMQLDLPQTASGP